MPEQHHRVLKLLHDIIAAAASAPRSNRTVQLLLQLASLLSDGAWRPFLLRRGLLLVTADRQLQHQNGPAAATAGPAAAESQLDQLMADHADIFRPEMKLPLAFLLLAATGSAAVQAAAAAVLVQVDFGLTDYGCMPGEEAGECCELERQQLGHLLLQSRVRVGSAATAAGFADASGVFLLQLPFVQGYLKLAGFQRQLEQVLTRLHVEATPQATAIAPQAVGELGMLLGMVCCMLAMNRVCTVPSLGCCGAQSCVC